MCLEHCDLGLQALNGARLAIEHVLNASEILARVDAALLQAAQQVTFTFACLAQIAELMLVRRHQ